MFSEMTKRERMLAAINRQPLDRLPTDYWATDEATEKLMKHLGITDGNELMDALKIDGFAWGGCRYIGPSSKKIEDGYYDSWGVGYKAVKYANDEGVYYEMFDHPIQNYGTIDEIEANYTFPSADWFDYSDIERQLNECGDRAVQLGYMAPFYMYCNIRGLEQALMDMAGEPEIADYILGRISDYLYEHHKRIFEAADGKVDVTQVTDDFGTQTGLMISLEMFDRFFKKHFDRFIKLAKSHNIKVFHHDDGAMAELIPSLIELGIDILNPIQWRLPGMELEGLKKNFGDKLCFHGGVDNQYVLPFGTVDEVKKEVETCISILASDKTGYIPGPCHNIQVISPVENVIAMYDAIREFGKMN